MTENIPIRGHEVDAERAEVSVPLKYVGVEERPVLYASQFIAQRVRGGLNLGIGQVTPPILIGNKAERREQLAAVEVVPVVMLARFSTTREVAEELVDLLKRQLAEPVAEDES